MPYAKLDVELLQRFAEIPERDRAKAVALYLALVLNSAQLLTDGRISRAVLAAGADEIGISHGRYSQREVSKTVTSLVDSGLLEPSKNGTLMLSEWQVHHSSRADVETQRKRATERKRRSRSQLVLPTVTAEVTPGRHTNVTEGQDRDSRAHARRRKASDVSTSKAVPIASYAEPEPSLDDDDAPEPDTNGPGFTIPTNTLRSLP